MGNQQHTGYYSSKSIEKGIGTKWTFKTNGSIIGSPALVNNIIYIGSNDSCMYAIDTKGGLKWKKKTNGKISSTPAVFGNTVYFISYDGYFYALDTTNGTEKWKFKTRGEHRRGAIGLYGYKPTDQMQYDTYEPYQSSAVVVDTLVVFGCGDSSIYCLNTKSGTEFWQFKTGNVVHSSPAYYNGKIYCGGHDCKLYAIDIKTGNKVWEKIVADPNLPVTDVYSGNISSPSVSEGIVYIGSKSNYLGAYDAETGAHKFSYSTSDIWVVSTPAIANGSVYAGTSGFNILFSCDAKTGKNRFSKNLLNTAYGSWTWPSACITGNMVYIGSLCGSLLGADTTGRFRWRYRTIGSLNDKRQMFLFNGDKNPDFDLSTIQGSTDSDKSDIFTQWRLDAGVINGNAITDNGVVYFGSGDGYLYAITDGFAEISFSEALLEMKPLTKRTTYDTIVSITNKAGTAENFSIYLDGSIEDANKKGFSFSPSSLDLQPGETKTIKISIDTKNLEKKSYSVKFFVKSTISPEVNWYSKSVFYTFNPVSAIEKPEKKNKSEIEVFPNPFTKEVCFTYNLKNSSDVELNILDLQGRLIETVINKLQYAGCHTIEWKANFDLRNGTYIYRLKTKDEVFSGKLIKE